MTRILFFLIGIILSIIGMIYTILYLNLLTIGYSLFEYIYFLFTRVECLIGLIGFIMVATTIFYKG